MGVMPLLALLLTALVSTETQAHDPSAYGGLFRSRDHGVSWFPADTGLFLSGVLDVAISPTDANALLLATDTGLLRSQNGGRTWAREAPTVLVSGVSAVAFDADGRGALASTATGLYRTDDGNHWWKVSAPGGVAAAYAIVSGGDARRLYVAGPGGLWRSDDRGRSWLDTGEGLPAGAVRRLLVVTAPDEILYAIAAGRLWRRTNGLRGWQAHDTGLPVGRVEALALDIGAPERLWAAAADCIFVRADRGVSWRPVGQPLPDAHTAVHGFAVAEAGTVMVLTTHRGLLWSADGGHSWRLMEENLPVHLEAGPLVRDPTNAAALYAGFSLLPYDELWDLVLKGKPLLQRVEPLSLAGGTAFLLALALLGGLAVHWLAHARRLTRPARPGSKEPRP